MEKIRVNNTEFNLVPMGISETGKARNITISTALTNDEIITAISDVSKIEYLSETGEVLQTYLDGVKAKSIINHLDGTYTIEISIDPIERQLADLQAQIDALKK
jgi:multidrug efflux pump subunit AcrB